MIYALWFLIIIEIFCGFLIIKLFKRKPKRTLKDVCIELYGEEYGKQYDILASGGTIGDLQTTIVFIEKLELAKMVSEDAWQKLRKK